MTHRPLVVVETLGQVVVVVVQCVVIDTTVHHVTRTTETVLRRSLKQEVKAAEGER